MQVLKNINLRCEVADIKAGNLSPFISTYEEILRWDVHTYLLKVNFAIKNYNVKNTEATLKTAVGRAYLKRFILKYPHAFFFLSDVARNLVLHALSDFDDSGKSLHTLSPNIKFFLTESLEEFISLHNLDPKLTTASYMDILKFANTGSL